MLCVVRVVLLSFCLALFSKTGALPWEAVDGHHLQHTLDKRSEMSLLLLAHVDTDFMQKSITVQEDIGISVLADTLCVKGGPNKRSFGLFSARGPAERCSGGPCPEATENVDFVRVYVEEFRVDPGELLCFNVTILNDTLVEGREFFLVGLLDLRWGEVLSTAAITIIDNDSPSLELERAVVEESVGDFEFCLNGGIIDLPLVVQTGNTADLVESTELFTIFAGEQACVNVSVVDDQLFENLEIVEINIKSANISIGNFSETFSLYIFDNDETARFERTSYVVDEDDGEVEVCIVFSADFTLSVESSVLIRDGSAREGSDYSGSDQTLQINGGERKCVRITIIDDDNAERAETLLLSLNSSNSEVPEPFQATITIQDNDVITFQESEYRTIEGETGVDVCVLLPSQGGTKNGLLVTDSGSATERLDFFPLPRVFFNITGSEKRCFFIFNYRDNLPELQEEFTVRVYTLLDDRFAIDSRTARIILEDDDTDLCGNLTEPENGKIVQFTDENNPGSRVIYSCNFGFRLTGLNGDSRTCLLSGEWDGQDPTCIATMCPTLNDPVNGKVIVPNRTLGSIAMYNCDGGYQLDGNPQRVCLILVRGVWSGTAPLCKLIECPVLSKPANGTISLPAVRTPGSIAEYACLDGFVIVGADKRVCLDSGNWNGTEPTCIGALNVEPVGVRFISNTPRISGHTVTINMSISGPVDKVTCSLARKVVEEDFKNRTKGGMVFTHVPPGGHTLEVTVSSLISEEGAYISRFFEIGSKPNFCGLHLINQGFVVESHRLRVQFAAVPTFKSYRCKLDGDPGFDCTSPVEMGGIKPGRHRLKIMHNRYECGYRRKLFIHFDIDDTPDNPHNNV